jgi:hypothetical protein
LKNQPELGLFNDRAVFIGGKHMLSIDDLPLEIWSRLEEIHDFEIIYQETDRYIRDKTTEMYFES